MGFSLKGCCLNVGSKQILLCLWVGISGISFWRTYINYKNDPQYYYVHKILGSWMCIGLASATVLNLNCAALLLPMCHTLMTLLRALGRKIGTWGTRHILDTKKSFHILCGYIVFTVSWLHVTAHVFNIVNFSRNFYTAYPKVNPSPNPQQSAVSTVLISVPGITGVLLLLVILFVVLTSFRPIRDRNFNMFWYSHRLFVVFYALLVIHGFNGPIRRQLNVDEHYPECNSTNTTLPHFGLNVTSGVEDHHVTAQCYAEPVFGYTGLDSWKWLCFPLLLYLMDALYRSFRRQTPSSVVCVDAISAGVMQITLEICNFSSKPGQYVLLQVPSISTTEWHPYSIVELTKPDSTVCKVWLKNSGDWSGKVIKMLSGEDTLMDTTASQVNRHRNEMVVNVDGPFSSPLEELGKFRVTLCVAGGIGITPFIFHLQHIRRQCCNGHAIRIKRLVLLLLSRDWTFLAACGLLLQDIHNALVTMTPDLLNIRFYYTGDAVADQTEDKRFLRQRLSYGRPKLNELFADLSRTHKAQKIGVFSCGPAELNETVKELCFQKHESAFYFHKETF